MSESGRYMNTMRVKRMREAVRIGELCAACGQIVKIIDPQDDKPGGAYCLICGQLIEATKEEP